MVCNSPTPSLATSKERLETIMEIQPRDTSRGHFYVSLVKSLLRIIAGIAFVGTAFEWGSIFAGGCLIIVAEVLGIVEEIV